MENNELEIILTELTTQQRLKQQELTDLIKDKLDQAELLREKVQLHLQNITAEIAAVKQSQQLLSENEINLDQALTDIQTQLNELSSAENNQNTLIKQRLSEFLALEMEKRQQQIQLPLRALDFAIAELNSTFTPIQQKVESKLSGLATKISRKFQVSKLLLAKQLEKGAVRLRQQKTAG